jgi:hypothetical protein
MFDKYFIKEEVSKPFAPILLIFGVFYLTRDIPISLGALFCTITVWCFLIKYNKKDLTFYIILYLIAILGLVLKTQ